MLSLPRLVRIRRIGRFRLVGWMQEHATAPRDAITAWAAVAISWSLRGLALFVLLGALGLHTSFVLALAFLCASSASAVLPIAPAGAVTQAGAGAAILVAAGMHPDEALAFGVAAQGLVIAAGAVCVVAIGSLARRGPRPARVRPVALRRLDARCEDAAVRKVNILSPEFEQAWERDGYKPPLGGARQAAGRGEDRRLALRAARRREDVPVPLPPLHGGVGDRRRRHADAARAGRRARVAARRRRLLPGRTRTAATSCAARARCCMLSASQQIEAIEYPDSGKIGVRPPRKIFRIDETADYFEGE